jgi:hypothetical protein
LRKLWNSWAAKATLATLLSKRSKNFGSLGMKEILGKMHLSDTAKVYVRSVIVRKRLNN